MARHLTEPKLVVASHNKGKIREIEDLLQPFGVDVVSALELGLPEPEETGQTFAENAALKAEAATRATGLPSLSDDSGLVVPALGGKPGIFSARWAGPEKDFGQAMEKVEAALAKVDGANRSAYFVCVLCLAWPDGHTELFEGVVHGALVWPPRGENGFGYDPVFQAHGYEITFGEMAPAAKHAISHRADAFSQLIRACFSGE